MQTFEYIIKDESGIHARPAGMLAQTAKNFKSEITVTKDNTTVNATNIMMLMGLCAKCGDKIIVSATGEDENDAISAMENFLNTTL